MQYDYNHQAWVKNGKYVKCNHPESMQCDCYGKKHEGEDAQPLYVKNGRVVFAGAKTA